MAAETLRLYTVLEFDANTSKLVTVKKDFTDVIGSISRTRVEMKGLKKEMDKLSGKYMLNPHESKRLTEVTQKYARLQKQMVSYNAAKAQEARAIRESINGNTGLANSSLGIKWAMVQVATAVGSVIAIYHALNRTIGWAIRAFSEFEETLTNVQTLLGEYNDSLEEGSLYLMQRYGLTIQDTNKAMFDAVSAGVKAADAITFMDQAARLAVGGVTSLKSAVDGLTSIINAYQLEVSEARRVAEAFFEAQRFGKTTVELLANNIGRVAPIAAIANISYQELLSTLAELTVGGLNTEESVTILRQAIAALIKPAVGAEEALRKFGVPVGIAEVRTAGWFYSLQKLQEAARIMPDVISEMIPNIRAFTGAAALNEDRLENLNKVYEEVMTKTGDLSSLTKAFSMQMLTFSKSQDIFNAKMKRLAILAGDFVAPAIEKIMSNIDVLVGVIAGAVAGLTAFYFALRKTAMAALVTKAILNPLATLLSLVAAIATGTIVFKLFNRALEDTSDVLGEHTYKLTMAKAAANKLFEELKNSNTTSERQEEIIKELNDTYGEYINLKKEDLETTQGLENAQRKLNEAIEETVGSITREAAIRQIEQKYSSRTIKSFRGIEDILEGMFFGRDTARKIMEVFVDEVNSQIEKNYEHIDYDAILKRFEELGIDISKIDFTYTDVVIGEKSREEITKLTEFGEAVTKYFKAIRDFKNDLKNVDLIIQGFSGTAEEVAEQTYEYLKKNFLWKKMTTEQLDRFIGDLDEMKEEEVGVWKSTLIERTKVQVEGLKKLRENSEEEEKIITSQALKITQAYNRAISALTDEQVSQIDLYQFYVKKNFGEFFVAYDYTTELTEDEWIQTQKAIREFQQMQQKDLLDWEKQMVKMQIEQAKLMTEMMPEGAEKQLAEIEIRKTQSIISLKENYQKEKLDLFQQLQDQEFVPMGGFEKNYAVFVKKLEELHENYISTKILLEQKYGRESQEVIDHVKDSAIELTDKIIGMYNPMVKLTVKFSQLRLEIAKMKKDIKNVLDKEDAEKFSETIDDLLDKIEQYEIDSLKLERDKKLGISTYAQERDLKLDELGLGEDAEIAEVERRAAAELMTEQEKFDQIEQIHRDYDRARRDIESDYHVWWINMTEREKERKLEVYTTLVDMASNMTNQIVTLMNEADQRMFQQRQEYLRDQQETESEILQNRLDKSLLTEEQFKKEKEKIDLKFRRREEALKREQFEREKRRNIAQAFMEGALAILKTYVTAGGWNPVSQAMAALMAAETALNVAVIAAQTYSKGGLVGGRSHAAGGTKYYGEDGNAFEVERGELITVVNKRDTAMLQALSAANSINGDAFFGRGGVFQDGGIASRMGGDQLFESLTRATFVVHVDEILDKINNVVSVREQARI